MKRAFITGATGQDGYYLSKLLLAKGYDVHLQSRRVRPAQPASATTWHEVDLTDRRAVEKLCDSLQPQEIYNLAAISQPEETWRVPLDTALINGVVPIYFLEIVRTGLPDCRLYQASSSEMFGDAVTSPQDELTPFRPQTPYAVAKVHAHQMVSAYRRRFGLFTCSGILFNHDSPRRPLCFVTQKIAYAAALIASGIHDSKERDERGQPIVSGGRVSLGNIDVSRDFGYAGDYVKAMWLMLQQEAPDDYIVGSGETHSIRDICKVAFEHAGLNWKEHVRLDQGLIRPLENRHTIANAEKARRSLGWKPEVSFEDLVRMMVDARLRILSNGHYDRPGAKVAFDE